MSDYTIRLGFEGPGFVPVPNSVAADRSVSADMLAALVFMAQVAGGRTGQAVRVSAVRARFGWGERVWRKVFGQMVDAGCLAFAYGRADDGSSISRTLVVGWPGSMPEVERDAVRRAVARPSRKGLAVGVATLPDGEVFEPVNDKTSFTQSAVAATTKRRSGERQNVVGVNDKTSLLIQTQTQTAAEPAALKAKQVSAARSEKRDTREAVAVDKSTDAGSRGEAAQVAENGQSEAVAVALRGPHARAVEAGLVLAENGMEAICPSSRLRIPADRWLAKLRAGEFAGQGA